jgi:small subunit ribosomal protein S20
MAHSVSARKRIRQDLKRRARNRRRKKVVRLATREFEEAVGTGNAASSLEAFKNVQKKLDQIAAKGAIHKRTAARRKSRMARKVNRLVNSE